MKARELRDYLCNGNLARELDSEVRVVLNQPGIPTAPSVGVKSVGYGFDWTAGMFMIRTDEPIISKPKTKKKRRDEWEEERKKLMEQNTRRLGTIAASMRLLAKVRALSDLKPEVLEAIETYEQNVRNLNKTS